MTQPLCSRPRRRLFSPAAQAMRVQRIFARLQEGASYADIAAEERISRERLRQIIQQATARGRDGDLPDHARMQITRLVPALRFAAAGVAGGDAKAVPLLLSLVDRLDRYSDPDTSFRSPSLDEFVRPPARRRRPSVRPRAANAPESAGEEGCENGAKGPAPLANPPSH